jgi:hypothetical protein
MFLFPKNIFKNQANFFLRFILLYSNATIPPPKTMVLLFKITTITSARLIYKNFISYFFSYSNFAPQAEQNFAFKELAAPH